RKVPPQYIGMAGFGRIELDFEMEPGGEYLLEGEAFSSLLLWRPRQGEAVTVAGPSGDLFRARVQGLGKNSAEITVFERAGRVRRPLDITLLQALPERERMELIIQKTTELGVSAIVPFRAERSISLEERESRQKKAHKWGEIALKASKQSRRDTIAAVLPYVGFKEALKTGQAKDLRLALSEKKGIAGIRDALAEARKNEIKSAALLVGPEGGLTESEMEEAEGRGFTPVSLGQRTLRVETAAIIGVGLITYELGE
ncbi:MAG TPA: RsmE family RNA methyltransferase, partial [Thermodesulfobacteriota bacterium]|nr:RsmE family RNA methyltransferase [Thermodesulfobacteriota bacterium]